MKIRIKFKKHGLIKFIGHLDLIRAWQKIFRRSDIPIAYSEGFNPHQIFSIAAPLAVGITSDGEYLDLKLSVEAYDLNQLVDEINMTSPEGIEVIEAVELIDKETAGMAACKLARYEVTLSPELNALFDKEKVLGFLNSETIIVQKRNKKGKYNDLDLKAGMFEYEFDNGMFKLLLATGSSLNVKPELLLTALFKFLNIELESFTRELYYMIHRIDIYMSHEPLLTLTEGVAK